MPSQSSYYDIDAILAEEELVPCTTQFDFSYLAHLDPDVHDKSYLPEASRVKLPLWAVEKWAEMNFVFLALPRHYQRKARERLEAAPSEVNLRKRNERFFMAGRFLVDLIEMSAHKLKSSANAKLRSKLEQVAQEASELRNTLLKTYTGERLRQTLDWSLSSVGDDVSSYTGPLTEMERRLFLCGSSAATAHLKWREHGKRTRLLRPPPKTTTTTSTASSATTKRSQSTRPVTPDSEIVAGGAAAANNNKRPRHA